MPWLGCPPSLVCRGSACPREPRVQAPACRGSSQQGKPSKEGELQRKGLLWLAGAAVVITGTTNLRGSGGCADLRDRAPRAQQMTAAAAHAGAGYVLFQGQYFQLVIVDDGSDDDADGEDGS